MPKNLSVEQKANRLEMCQDLLGRLEIEPDFINKVIVGDESRVFEYDPETQRQSAEWHTKSSHRPKKARMSRSRAKTVIIVFFFGSRGIVHKGSVPPGQTIIPSTKMSWNDFENGSSESEWTLQTIRCCTTIKRQLTLRFQFEDFWQRRTFPYLHILPTAHI